MPILMLGGRSPGAVEVFLPTVWTESLRTLAMSFSSHVGRDRSPKIKLFSIIFPRPLQFAGVLNSKKLQATLAKRFKNQGVKRGGLKNEAGKVSAVLKEARAVKIMTCLTKSRFWAFASIALAKGIVKTKTPMQSAHANFANTKTKSCRAVLATGSPSPT